MIAGVPEKEGYYREYDRKQVGEWPGKCQNTK